MPRIPLCELLTLDEAAAAAKVSRRTINRRIEEGKLKRRGLPSMPRIWVKDLEKLYSLPCKAA